MSISCWNVSCRNDRDMEETWKNHLVEQISFKNSPKNTSLRLFFLAKIELRHGCGVGHPNLKCQIILQYMSFLDDVFNHFL